LIIWTRISIGATTILSVSFDKTMEPTHIKIQVKMVIVNYYLASDIDWFLMLYLA
jgi:hypothetical protein